VLRSPTKDTPLQWLEVLRCTGTFGTDNEDRDKNETLFKHPLTGFTEDSLGLLPAFLDTHQGEVSEQVPIIARLGILAPLDLHLEIILETLHALARHESKKFQTNKEMFQFNQDSLHIW
jgi:hypothetical protein